MTDKDRILRIEKMMYHLLFQQDIELRAAKQDPETRKPDVMNAYVLSQETLQKLLRELHIHLENESGYREVMRGRGTPVNDNVFVPNVGLYCICGCALELQITPDADAASDIRDMQAFVSMHTDTTNGHRIVSREEWSATASAPIATPQPEDFRFNLLETD